MAQKKTSKKVTRLPAHLLRKAEVVEARPKARLWIGQQAEVRITRTFVRRSKKSAGLVAGLVGEIDQFDLSHYVFLPKGKEDEAVTQKLGHLPGIEALAQAVCTAWDRLLAEEARLLEEAEASGEEPDLSKAYGYARLRRACPAVFAVRPSSPEYGGAKVPWERIFRL